MRITGIRAVIAASMLAASLGGCTVVDGRQTAGEYLDDATISTQVRARIVQDRSLRLTQIDVETFRGTVQLSGFVESDAMRMHAAETVRGVRGVQEVRNDLVVRPRS